MDEQSTARGDINIIIELVSQNKDMKKTKSDMTFWPARV